MTIRERIAFIRRFYAEAMLMAADAERLVAENDRLTKIETAAKAVDENPLCEWSDQTYACTAKNPCAHCVALAALRRLL